MRKRKKEEREKKETIRHPLSAIQVEGKFIGGFHLVGLRVGSTVSGWALIFFASVFESHDVAACCFAAAPLREQEEEARKRRSSPQKPPIIFLLDKKERVS